MKPGNIQLSRLLEEGFVIAALLLSTGLDLSLQVLPPGVGPSEGNTAQQAINMINYSVVILLLAWNGKRVAKVVSRDLLLWMLLGLACVSVIWSAMPDLTLRRSGALVGTTAVGVYLAARFSIGEQVRLLAKVLFLAAIINLAVIVLWPERGIYGNELGARGLYYRGLYENKNAMGRLMALGALTMVFAFFDGKHRSFWSLGIVLCLSVLALSRSGTAMGVLALALAVLPVLMLLRWHYRLILPLLASALAPVGLAAVWCWVNADTVLTMLGKDITFTGRTDIWMAVMDMVEQRPWLGFGLNGFWRGWDGPSAYVCQIAGWEVPHAHNGFLDVWLALGAWGLALFIVVFMLAFFRALAAMVRSVDEWEGYWPVVFLLFIFCYNLTESTLLRPHSILWMLFVAAVLSRPAAKMGLVVLPPPIREIA